MPLNHKKRLISYYISALQFAVVEYIFSTGKSLSEALIFASTNPQYEDRFFIKLQVQYMKILSSERVVYRKLFFTFRTISVPNLSSPCSAKRGASDKDLPVNTK